MDSGRTEHRRESKRVAPCGHEEQQVEICRQNSKENIAERQNLAVPDRADSDEHGSTALNPEVTQAVFSDDPARQLEATTTLRKLLSKEANLPVDRIIACGAVPRFVEFLAGPHTALQRNDLATEVGHRFEAAWALNTIASGTTEHTMVVINSGAIPHFISLLSSPILDVREQAVWALGTVAGNSPMCRDYVILAGALKPLLALLSEQHKLSMLRNGAWTLSNFCRGRQPQPDWNLISPALPTLSKLIHSPDDEVLIDACWAISYLSDGNNDRIEAVIEAGVVPRLVELLNHPSRSVQTPALRSVGNLATGDDLQTQIVIAAGALPALSTLLTSPKNIMRNEACWIISNITAGSTSQIQAVIEANLIPPLIDILTNSPDFKTRKSACWAISSATSGGLLEPSQIRYLVQQGCIKPLCDLLTTTDNKTIEVALDAINNILKVGELDRLAAGAGAVNQYAILVEDAGGMLTIHNLHTRNNMEIDETMRNLLIRTSDPGFP